MSKIERQRELARLLRVGLQAYHIREDGDVKLVERSDAGLGASIAGLALIGKEGVEQALRFSEPDLFPEAAAALGMFVGELYEFMEECVGMSSSEALSLLDRGEFPI